MEAKSITKAQILLDGGKKEIEVNPTETNHIKNLEYIQAALRKDSTKVKGKQEWTTLSCRSSGDFNF